MSEKLAYCFGDPALTLMYTMTTTLLIYFYTNVVGISAGSVGMIMLVSRVFDGFSDVLMGTIIDRTHSKYGKSRIWILRLAVPYALAAIVLFTMPGMGPKGKVVYAFVTYNIMNTVVYTAISQPFHALGSLMSRDRRERDVICNIRMILSITASMVITAFTLPLINKVAALIGNEQAAWILVTAVYAVISVFVLLNTYATCTERVQTAQKSKDNIPFWTALKATVSNPYFLIALGLMLFYTVYQIIIGTDLTYYCQYVLNDVDLVMPLSASEKIATIVGIALLPKLLPKFGKRNLICAYPWCCRTASVPDEYYQYTSGSPHLYHEGIRNRPVLRGAVFSSKRRHRIRTVEDRASYRRADVLIHEYGAEGRIRLHICNNGKYSVLGGIRRIEGHGGRADG